MKHFFTTLLILISTSNIYSQSYNGLDHAEDVTYEISPDQYIDIKLDVLKNGEISTFKDVSANVIKYSFNDTDVYALPCDLDPMIQVDSIMPEYNYCQLVFEIKFGSLLYNSFFQYMYLKLIGNRVILEPIYNDPQPEYTMKKEDLIIIVQNVIDQINSED